jgi:hypothetical protein
MKKKLEFLDLHKSFFHAGTNFQDKLYSRSGKGDLEMYWDSEVRLFEITGKGQTSWITEASVFSFSETDPRQNKGMQIFNSTRVIPTKAQAQVGGPERFQAQVETPIDKVQDGRKRRPKYQGGETQGE